MATKCSHEDSRLTCIDCSSPICGQCLVQCPVGFRCKACVGGGSSASGKRKGPATAPWLVARTLLMFTGIGCGAGWLMPFIRVPYLSCIICYFLGLFTGRWAARFIDNKLGDNVTKVIVFGILIGFCFSPYAALPLIMFETVRASAMAQELNIFQGLTAIVGGLFSPVLFVVGILKATVWGERW